MTDSAFDFDSEDDAESLWDSYQTKGNVMVDKTLSLRSTYTHDEREGVKVIVSKDDLDTLYDLARDAGYCSEYEDQVKARIAKTLGK